MKNRFALLFSILLCNGTSSFQGLKTLQVNFERYYIEKGSEEIVKGSIYYQTPHKITVVVTNPIRQWMIFEDKQITIYYPDERKVFQIVTQYPVSLPFFQSFVGVVKEDYGLTDIGYVLSNYETKGDTLISYWTPPQKRGKVLGEFMLIYVSNKIVYVELKNSEGTVMGKSFYENHIRYGAIYFPLQVSTTRYRETDSTSEKVIYASPQFNTELPQEVKDFKIPLDAEIKEIEW